MMSSEKRIEIMAPAGDQAALSAALRAGADSVYFGAGKLNMRARATANFDISDIREVVRKCHACNAKAYLTLNSIIFESERAEVEALLDVCAKEKVDAVIAADFAVILAANARGVPVHLSVQCNITNVAALKMYAPYICAFVPARELTLEHIAEMAQAIENQNIIGFDKKPVRIEAFAHGALCTAYSGRCMMSLATYGTCASANRGSCFQPCRRAYTVTDAETGTQWTVDGHYILSPKDLCTLPHLDKLIHSGVSILKIEGRGRGPEYVDMTVRAYAAARDAVVNNAWEKFDCAAALERLKKVFNRGFWEGGYYLGKPNEAWCREKVNQTEEFKMEVGRIEKYYAKIGVAECVVRANSVACGDEIYVSGPTTGVVRVTLKRMRVGTEAKDVNFAQRGDVFSFECAQKVRTNDLVYVIRKKNGE